MLVVLPLILSPISWGADFDKGLQAYNSGDYQTALTEWQPLAEANNADAQFGMGLLYANGFGVALDDAQALKWYLLAAEQNHADAQVNLAVMHANGWGVPQSDEEAVKWYSLAADQGVTPAQIAVGKMYSGGFGATEDKVQAHMWFSIASALGDYNATSKRDNLAARMSAEEIAEANSLADSWMQGFQTMHANQVQNAK
jgi:TPR repeat protein